MTGAGIGIGVASKLGESTLVCASAASAGMIGAFASGLLNGSVSSSGKILLSGPGEPLGAFVAAYIGIEIGRIFIGRTKLDIILTPLTTIVCGGIVGLTVGPYISRSHETDRRDDSMGNRTAAIFDGNCCFCIDGYGVNSSDQFSSTWNYFESFWNCRRSSNDWVLCTDDRICDGQFTENGIGGLLAQGIGTSMLQVPNIVRKPLIWLPPIITSAILGPISTVVLK